MQHDLVKQVHVRVSEPIPIFNSFEVLGIVDNTDHSRLTGGCRLAGVSTRSTPTSTKPLHQSKSLDRESGETILATGLQQLQTSFKCHLRKATLLDPMLPRGAVIDAKDIELLNNVSKKSRRPINYNKRLQQYLSLAKLSLVSHD